MQHIGEGLRSRKLYDAKHQQKSDFVKETHQLFVRVANDKLPDPSNRVDKASSDDSGVDRLEYGLKKDNTQHTAVFRPSELEIVDDDVCRRCLMCSN